jgi:hypothetical protein
VSIEVPTGNPATSRPPLIMSSIAISSATLRGGWYRARLLPRTISAPREVVRDRMEAMRLGEGIRP